MSELSPAEPVVAPRPFLKWAGGKAGLLSQYRRYLPGPGEYRRYVEPFLGGGALFFHLLPPASVLADVNRQLINCYEVVQREVEALIAALAGHRNDRAWFQEVREQDPADLDPVAQAARFVYLNRTCYNGLYRVNRQGRFNVPFGSYRNPRLCDAEGLRAASRALAHTELRCGDFGETTADLGRGDFVYLDPPYVPVSATASFTDYAEEGFGVKDQQRLAALYHELDVRECRLLLSNSRTPLVEALYKAEDRGFTFREIKARRVISCNAETRGEITEYLIANYPLPQPRRH
jgi:DNA adenine methylase